MRETMISHDPSGELARWEREDGGARWVPGPEGGILTQRFVATVCAILPDDPLLRRWVFIRWQGTPAEEIAEHFGTDLAEVRAALDAAREMLAENEYSLLRVLIMEERDILDCMRHQDHSRPPQGHMPKSWAADGSTTTPALPRVREDTADGAAVERLEWLLSLLAQ